MTENNNKYSRRGFLGLMGAAFTAKAASAQQGFDFLGTGSGNSDFDFIVRSNPRQGNTAQRQTQSSPAQSRASAMNQRTPSSRPITQQRYNGSAPVGSIQVSITQATLYHITGPGVATAYPIGAGDDSYSLIGQNLVIGRKAAWPTWTPTANIARRLGISQNTQAGGPNNPLGAYALYLYKNGRDTIYRIHGTNDPSSVGNPRASSGCIRMYNEDVTRLQQYVPVGTRVSVHSGPVPGIGPSGKAQRLNR